MKRLLTIIFVLGIWVTGSLHMAFAQQPTGDKTVEETDTFCIPAPRGDTVFTATAIDSIKPMRKGWTRLYLSRDSDKSHVIITRKTCYKVGDTFEGKVAMLTRFKLKYWELKNTPLYIKLDGEEFLFSQESLDNHEYYLDR